MRKNKYGPIERSTAKGYVGEWSVGMPEELHVRPEGIQAQIKEFMNNELIYYRDGAIAATTLYSIFLNHARPRNPALVPLVDFHTFLSFLEVTEWLPGDDPRARKIAVDQGAGLRILGVRRRTT